MGVAASARQPCYLIPPPEFRSVALRPTLSGGLPFASYFCFINRRIIAVFYFLDRIMMIFLLATD